MPGWLSGAVLAGILIVSNNLIVAFVHLCHSFILGVENDLQRPSGIEISYKPVPNPQI